MANLPSAVTRLLPWDAVVNGPTGAMPQDLWAKIGAIASTVVNTLIYVGQMIYKGLVALGTFLGNLAQAIADWGMSAPCRIPLIFSRISLYPPDGLSPLSDSGRPR